MHTPVHSSKQRAHGPATSGRPLLLVLTLAISPLCHAQSVKLVTHNGSKDKTAWITVYDTRTSRILEAGCVAPGGKREWSGGKYKSGSQYRIKGELTARPNCQAPISCDTTVQAAPVSSGPSGAVKPGAEARGSEYRLEHNMQTCFWDVVNKK
jgi:hypothetical protein